MNCSNPIPTFQINSDVHNTEDFKKELTHFNQILDRYDNIQVVPFSFSSLQDFQKFDSEKQKHIITQIKRTIQLYTHICNQEVLAATRTAREISSQFANTLNTLKLTTVKDNFDCMEHDDIIEIYNKDDIQIYRSPRLLTHCSYSLADLYVHTWQELFSRPQKIKDLSEIYAAQCVEKKQILKPEFPSYYLLERSSPQQRLFVLKVVCFAPIFTDTGERFGFMRVLRNISKTGHIKNISEIKYLGNETLGKLLQTKRIAKKVSVFDAAEALQESNLYVKEIEQDRIFPTGSNIIKLCSLYGIETEEILEFLTNHAEPSNKLDSSP